MKIENPNLALIAGFSIALIFYMLQWSDLYQTLSLSTLLLLIFIAATNFLFAKKTQLIINWQEYNKKEERQSGNYFIFSAALIIILIVDFFAGKIPTLNIILITISYFYCTHLLSIYLSTKNKYILIYCGSLFLVNSILNPFRILIFFGFVSFLVLYLRSRKPFRSVSGSFLIICFGIILIYIFGLLGNYLKGDDYKSGDFILAIGQANSNFKTSFFASSELFWIYLYASSPLANLDLNFIANNYLQFQAGNILPWLFSEFTPDFISKTVLPLIINERPEGLQINSALNVSTVFIRSYLYFGWTGIIVMLLFLVAFPLVYLRAIRTSRYFSAGLATLTTIYLFMIFDNMLAFSPLSFQLAYPLIFKYKLRFS